VSARAGRVSLVFSLLSLSLVPVSLALWLGPSVLGACGSSPSPTVCDDIADCSQYASATWTQGCKRTSALLQAQIADGGCGGQLGAYYACASANFVCQGTTAAFPGCDSPQAELDLCLEGTAAVTYCAQLAGAKAPCSATPEHDAGASDAGAASTCSFANDCQAECYLANVTDQCNPSVTQVQAAALCILGCPQ
jgi:hypothetical protein